jgi:protein SCO1/2
MKILARMPLAIIIAFSLLLTGCLGEGEKTLTFYGDDIIENVAFSPFVLTDQNNTTFNSSQLDGKVAVFAFLFTNCPDICPIVSANLKYVGEQLGEDFGTEVIIITITVDPWRDNSSILKEYSDDKGLFWPHLTGEVEELEPIWADFGVGLEVVEQNGTSARHHPEAYEVDHSTGTIIVDREGKQRVWWGDLDWAPDLIIEDIKSLL